MEQETLTTSIIDFKKKNMKKLAFIFTALLLLASCSKGYKVTVTFPDESANGETAFLTNYDTGDTLMSATVENQTCTFEGSADKGFFARLLVGGNRYGFIVEPGDVKLDIAEGNATSPLNDKMAAWSKEMADLANDSTISELIDENFVYIHVNYNPRKSEGEEKALLSKKMLERLSNPSRFGYPVFVVVDEQGKVLHIQDSSFLEEGESYNKEKVLRFFRNWTPRAVRP